MSQSDFHLLRWRVNCRPRCSTKVAGNPVAGSAEVNRRAVFDHFDALVECIRRDRLRKRVRWCDLARAGLLSPQEWSAERIAATVLYTLVAQLHDERELDRNT